MNFSKEEHDILVKAYKESNFDLTMFKKGMLDRPVNSPMPWHEMTPEDAYNTVEALKDLLFQWESEACRSFEGLPNWTNSGTPAYNLLMTAFDDAKPYLEDAMVDHVPFLRFPFLRFPFLLLPRSSYSAQQFR